MSIRCVAPSSVPGYRDDLGPAGATTPTRSTSRIGIKRRETLLSLLDALNQLTEDPDLAQEANQQPSFEADRDVPTVDEHFQTLGAEAFNKFQKRINNLDKELRNFANAARQLGSSVGILSSAFHLRERLAAVLYLFRENAADIFPHKVQRQPRAEALVNPTLNNRPTKRARRKPPPNVRRPTVDENLDPENFPEQLESFASDVTTFLNCLNEFPEFTDEAVNASIISFQSDLKYWASCLKVYKTQFRFPAVQRYIHDLTSEMGDHIDNITSNLSMFIEIGVPTIRFAQKHGATNLLNLSTVATFFSAVSATTLQFSVNLDHSARSDAVNCFWFASLVFSIAAAVNSLLGLTWKQAMYRSPGHRVPWWVLIWIKRSPLMFLVMSVACFSVGLCLFAYASGQSPVTSIITTLLTAFTSFGLAAVSLWFVIERWVFLRHRGKKWLGDVLEETNDHFWSLPGMNTVKDTYKQSRKAARHAGRQLSRVSSMTTSILSVQAGGSVEGDLEEGALPYYQTPEPIVVGRPRSATVASPISVSSDVKTPTSPIAADVSSEKVNDDANGNGTNVTETKARFTSAVRSVMMLQSASLVPGPLTLNPLTPRRQPTGSSSVTGHSDDSPDIPRRKGTVEVPAIRGSRVASLTPKLQSLETTQDLAAHQALVRHLQFSPNGRFLATSSWDRTSVIFEVGEPFTSHRVLAHPQGFVGQVAWSPDGKLLLTKLNRGIKVWTEDGVCRKTINRRRAVESITWFPGGEAFMSVEGSEVVKLNLNGEILDTFDFGKIKLHDVAVTPNAQRLLSVGPLLASPTGLHPSKSRVEKRLIVYNMATKQVENQTPVLNDVRDITLARNGLVALISYENKAPPQLWKLELVKDRENSAIVTGRLSLRHTYMPKVPVDFAGPSYFGGKNDTLVLCAGKAGDIHIWDRESGILLHHVRAQILGGDLTCIAWNHAAENPFMFATGSHDGAVRIWTTPSGESNGRDHSHDSSGGTRTPASFDYEANYRAESPIQSGILELHEDDESDAGPPPRESRSVVFATPQVP